MHIDKNQEEDGIKMPTTRMLMQSLEIASEQLIPMLKTLIFQLSLKDTNAVKKMSTLTPPQC